MGKVPNEEKERNIAIANDYRIYEGKTGVEAKEYLIDLVCKYRLSASRIHQIGKNEKYRK